MSTKSRQVTYGGRVSGAKRRYVPNAREAAKQT
jgi:hypothetical protein